MALAVDSNTTSGTAASGTTTASAATGYSFTNTAGTLLLVCVNANSGGGTASDVTAVSYGGQAMSLASKVRWDTSNASCVSIWYLLSPPTGANTVSMTVTSSALVGWISGAISFTGNDAFNPVRGLSSAFTATGNSAAPSVGVTGTSTGNIVVDFMGTGSGETANGQTLIWVKNVNGNSGGNNSASQRAAGTGGTVTMSYTVTADVWGIVAVEVVAGVARLAYVPARSPASTFRPNPTSRFRAPQAAFPQPAAPVFAEPTLVQHLSSSALVAARGLNGNNFKFTLPNQVGAGNCLILAVSFQWSSTKAVSSITDSSGDTWSATPVVTTTDGAKLISAIFVLANASAGLHTITVALNATSQVFSYVVSEFTNVATSSPVTGSVANSTKVAPEISTGTFTPSNNDSAGGNLIWSYFIDATDGSTANWVTNYTPDPNAQLLHADIAWHANGIPHAVQYQIQTITGPVNPRMYATMTPANDTFNSLAISLKAAQAGTFNPDAMRIVKLIHATNETPPGGSNWDFQFPSAGNLLIWGTANFDNILTVTGITDNKGNTWHKENNGDPGSTQIWWAGNAISGPDLILHVAVAASPTPQGASVCMYDVVGADPNPKDAVASAAQSANSITLLTDFPIITPPSFGITVVVLGLGQGPGLGLHAGSPAGAVFDLVNYTNETDLDTLDNADGKAHILNLDLATQHWNWDITSIASNNAFATAVHFKAAVAAPGSASFWPYFRAPFNRGGPNPMMRFQARSYGAFNPAVGAVALAGSIDSMASMALSINLATALAGSIDAQAALAAALSEAIALQGSIDAQATVSASMALALALSGSIDGTAVVAGSLQEAVALKGSIDATAVLSPINLTEAIALAGSISGQAVPTLSISEAVSLAGSISGAAVLLASLTVKSGTGTIIYPIFIFDD